MKKFILLLGFVIIFILCLIFITNSFQTRYEKKIFEQIIPLDNLHSPFLKQFLSSIGTKFLKCIVFNAHSHRNNFFVLLIGDINSELLKNYVNNDLIKLSTNNIAQTNKLQNYKILGNTSKYDRYLFTDINYPLNIYVQNNKIIIIYPIFITNSISEIIDKL